MMVDNTIILVECLLLNNSFIFERISAMSSRKTIHLLGAVLGAVLVVLGFFVQEPDGGGLIVVDPDVEGLRVTYLDVGQGDSMLIQTEDHQTILIDGGPDETVVHTLEDLLGGSERIDLVVLTHPHADHVRGLLEVFERFEVGRVLATGVMHTTQTYEAFLRVVSESGVAYETALSDQEYVFDEDTRLTVLFPFHDFGGKDIGEIDETLYELSDGLNDTSVVLRLDHGATRFLFMGDVSKKVERDLLDAYTSEELRSEVLKVGHQGSDTSSDLAFLQMVSPEVAVISVGANTYGHPHGGVLDRLISTGADVYRTDVEGNVTLVSDGVEVFVLSEE